MKEDNILKFVTLFCVLIILIIIVKYCFLIPDETLRSFAENEIILLGVNLHIKPISVIQIIGLISWMSFLEGFKKSLMRWFTPFKKKILIMIFFLFTMLISLEILLTYAVWTAQLVPYDVKKIDTTLIGPWTEFGPINIVVWSKLMILFLFCSLYFLYYIHKIPVSKRIEE